MDEVRIRPKPNKVQLDVIILCSGSADYFDATLDSVLAQTNLPEAIYVVDNGCPHRKYIDIAEAKNCRLIHCIKFDKRLRMTANWQRCLGVGTSSYFICLHDDDLWKPDFISRANTILSRDEAITACLLGHVSFMASPDAPEQTALQRKKEEGMRHVDGMEEPLRSFVIATTNLCHMCALVCRRVAIGYPIQNSYMPDQGFLANHAAYGKIAISPEIGVHIRMHQKSVTSSYSTNSRASFETLSQIRNILMFQIENRGFHGDQLAQISGKMPATYLFRILQACHSWPLRPSLLRFGRELLAAKPFKAPQLRDPGYRKYLGSIGWIIASMAADVGYSTKEKPVPN